MITTIHPQHQDSRGRLEAPHERVAVCVLGMQRSGTSLVTRLLNVLGVDLGPRYALIPPRDDNPGGFWEHRDIQSLNEEVLGRLGGSWAQPPSLEPGWEHAPEIEDLREQARAIIRRDFGRSRVWGWKDPTTSLTLPFWQGLVPDMRYVICLRHPVDSARSIQRRDGQSLEEGVESWLTHVRSSFEHTAGQSRVFVHYEHVLDDWHPTLRLLASFVNEPDRAEQISVLEQVERFVDPDLRHHRTSEDELRRLDLAPNTLAVAEQTYEALEQAPHLDQHAVVAMLDAALATVRPDADQRRLERFERWLGDARVMSEEIEALVPIGTSSIFVDQAKLTSAITIDRHVLPFLERGGQYWGVPPDDETAIQELERMRSGGASFIIFAWPALWWLDHFREFHHYLRSHFPCPLDNGRLVAFDLRQ